MAISDLTSLNSLNLAFQNLGAADLVERAIRNQEGALAENGALVVRTGQFTGRSPADKFIVRNSASESNVDWGPVNQSLSEEQFDRIYSRMKIYLAGRELYSQDLFAGAEPEYSLQVQVVTQLAWHALFARQLLIRPTAPVHRSPDFTLIFGPAFHSDPSIEGTHSETVIVINFQRKLVLIGGSMYAGELKKSIFTVLNYLLPERGVMPMHCSANMDAGGRVALFFGLSGTGKTTLSADPSRRLIGDDEHGWSDRGVFNFEGGCYAKCIRLSRQNEPQIWNAIRFGSVLENLVMDPVTRELDFESDAITENTRAAYPLDYIENAVIPSLGGHPDHVFFLAADAFGVLPPISRLNPEQAMYHFLSGYTAKVAGTERGLGKEPQAAFSACYGAPFLPRHPGVYASMLGEKLRRHDVQCWLVNTGWAGGPYGVGQRMKLAYTRAMLGAALAGRLNGVPMSPHPIFGVMVPASCPDVPPEFLDARGMWPDTADYDAAARALAARFNRNFEKFRMIDKNILEAAPVG